MYNDNLCSKFSINLIIKMKSFKIDEIAKNYTQLIYNRKQ
jgi:hypothetical protein